MTQPETTSALCAGCGHELHRPGIECETRVDHGRSFHLCLCLNLVDAFRACPPQMTCQGGTLGYSDIWHLQRGQSLSSAEGVITPDVLTTAAAGVVVPQPEPEGQHGLGPADGQQKMRLPAKLRAQLKPIPEESGTERRARYAAAVHSVVHQLNTVVDVVTYAPGNTTIWQEQADAAMAVADREQQEQACAQALQLGVLMRELSGLRDELAQARGAVPAWEAAYDSATFTPYLIGYCNDEGSAKAAALAWFRTNCETDDVLEWGPDPVMATGEWDQWHVLGRTDPDGTALATDIVVRHRAATGQGAVPPADSEQAAPVNWQAIVRQRESELKSVGEARHQAESAVTRVRAWVTSDVVAARNEFGSGYREAQRDIRDLINGATALEEPTS